MFRTSMLQVQNFNEFHEETGEFSNWTQFALPMEIIEFEILFKYAISVAYHGLHFNVHYRIRNFI